MKIGMVGLGKMGANMTERLLRGGHEVVAFDVSPEARAAAAAKGAEPASSLEELAAKLSPPRAAWVMVPSGAATDSTIAELAEKFERGDVIVDGGNSNYKGAAPTAERLARKGGFSLDLHEISSIWRYGSVVPSWLLELVERATRPGAGLDQIAPVIVDSGEGRWTSLEAIDRAVPAPVITAALFNRFSSRDKDSYANKLVAAMRNQFGGHAVTLESGRQGMETLAPVNG